MLTNALCLLTGLLAILALASNTSDTPAISNIAVSDKATVGSIIRTELSPLLSKSGEISLPSDGDSWRHKSRRYSHFQEPLLAAVVIVKNEDDILTTVCLLSLLSQADQGRLTGNLGAQMKYAQENKRTLLVKGGGNGLAKMSHLQDVIMLDLSEMNRVTLNIKARTMTVQPGARVEEMIEEIAHKKFRSREFFSANLFFLILADQHHSIPYRRLRGCDRSNTRRWSRRIRRRVRDHER